MPRYVALLRGINVGGHRVKMDRLREVVRELDVEDVDTFIASGNVLFTSPSEDVAALETRLEEHLSEALGFAVPALIRTTAEVRAVSQAAVSQEHPNHSVYVIFCAQEPDPSVRASLDALTSETDRFAFNGREVYWVIAGKLSESPLFGGAVTKVLKGVPHTMRNLTSVRKLLAQKVKPEG